jgi:homocysteine S-methyltransferase
MSCRDGISTNAGQRIEDAAAILHECPEVVALGVNCTAPQYIPELVQHMKKGTTKPIVVYPNSGEAYDAVSKTWSGTVSCDDYVVAAATWAQAGARIIGGCCRTTPAHIRALVDFFAAEPIR